MHGNGYVRELAVRHLALSTDVAALPWLTLRAGDWVREIREASATGIEHWFQTCYAQELISVLPMLEGARFAPGARPGRHRCCQLRGLSNRAGRGSLAPACRGASSHRAGRRTCRRRDRDAPPRTYELEFGQLPGSKRRFASATTRPGNGTAISQRQAPPPSPTRLGPEHRKSRRITSKARGAVTTEVPPGS